MDYGEILSKAQENDKQLAKKEVRCYKTEFSPPKKVKRSGVSSANIQKFLARKEQEEKEKLLEAQKKKEELLALRSQDKKAQKRVQVMLKRTKSANKSVMADAIDNVNTADTLNGPMQCDEDDYGYVSQEASAFYNKLMDKYQKMPAEKSIFSEKRKEVKDLNAAKDRVRAALEKEAEEQLHPRRKRKRKEEGCDDGSKDDLQVEEPQKEEPKKEPEPKKKKSIRPPPPPMDFTQLLKIAEKKQHEPIMIEKPIKEKEPERLMTQKEKMEHMKEQERLNKKTSGHKISPVERSLPPSSNNNVGLEKKETISKIPNILRKSHNSKSLNPKRTDPDTTERLKKSGETAKRPCNVSNSEPRSESRLDHDKYSSRIPKLPVKEDRSVNSIKNENEVQEGVSDQLSDLDKRIQDLLKKREMLAAARLKSEQASASSNKLKEKNRSTEGSKSDGRDPKRLEGLGKADSKSDKKVTDSRTSVSFRSDKAMVKPNRPKEMISKENKLKDLDEYKKRTKETIKPRPTDSDPTRKTASVPSNKSRDRMSEPHRERDSSRPSTMKGGGQRERELMKQLESKYSQQKAVNKLKRRNVIESESEYDSELDDFIDDGDEEIDYSRYIKEIFKYDKSRYADDDEEEDECMESNFAQQMREEYVSAKIGLLEDLEDIRKEQEEKKKMKAKQKKKA